MEDWEEKLDKGINWWKTSRTWWKNIEGKPKDNIIDKKTFQPELRTGKEKPKVGGERRDLVVIKYYLVPNGVKL